jgi:hypothetical protein
LLEGKKKPRKKPRTLGAKEVLLVPEKMKEEGEQKIRQ